MRSFALVSRILLGLAVLGFGVLYVCVAVSSRLPHIGPPFLAESHILSVAVGVLLLCAAVSLMLARVASISAAVLGVTAIACAALSYGPRVVHAIHYPDPWTGGAEMLAFGGGLLALAAVLLFPGRRGAGLVLRRLGELLFALSMGVFGVQHLLYGTFVANLLLPWMPWHLFWAYSVGLAFLAAAFAILVHVQARLAATMLGVMFSLWVLLLHGPLIWSHMHDGNQWTSGLVALAMAGCSFGVAAGAER